MSEEINQSQSEKIPQNAKSYIIKCINLEKNIKELKEVIKKLNKRLLEVNKEKEDLKITIHNNSVLSEQYANLKEEIENMRRQREEMIFKKDKEISNLTRKISALESKMQIDKADFNKTTEIYSSKMNTVTYLQMDNQAYKDEIQTLMKSQEEFKAQKEYELKLEKKNFEFKMDKFKQKMISNLEKTNEDLKNFNYQFMGANNKLLLEQKQKLFMIIEQKNEIINDLNKQIELLKDKIYEDEKDQEIHKLVEYNLAHKLILKNQSPDIKNKRGKKRILINNAKTGFPNLKKNQSQKEFFTKATFSNTNRDNFLYTNNINLPKSTSLENIEQYPQTQKTNFVFSRKRANYLKEIQEKNIEVEKEKLINIQLRNKLNIYKSKFKGLVDFLEENLQSFSKDEKLMAKTNFNSKSEKLKKCEFDEFNVEEKKELLSTLIKYLMPLANPDMDLSGYNESKTYFNTNLSITRLKKVNHKNYLHDDLLKKAFVNKANRYHKDILTGKNLIFNSSKNDTLDI